VPINEHSAKHVANNEHCAKDVANNEYRAKDVPDVSPVNGHLQLTVNGSDKEAAREEEDDEEKEGAARSIKEDEEAESEEIENGKANIAAAEDSLDDASEADTEEHKVTHNNDKIHLYYTSFQINTLLLCRGRLGVSQDILFRDNLPMRNQG
jgi:hypothetical protein